MTKYGSQIFLLDYLEALVLFFQQDTKQLHVFFHRFKKQEPAGTELFIFLGITVFQDGYNVVFFKTVFMVLHLGVKLGFVF